MSDVPTPAATNAAERLGCRQRLRGRASARHRLGLAAYYRLRNAVLEARIESLEAELEQTERQLETTIDRYEQILQRPDEEWVVVTNHAPGVDAPPTDD